jgi:tripartite-type tricarboxylate transporter receptor subunit TctC
MLLAPAGTAPTIVERMQREVANGLRNDEVKTRLTELGATPVGSTPKEAEAFLKGELARWADVARRAGIKPQD